MDAKNEVMTCFVYMKIDVSSYEISLRNIPTTLECKKMYRLGRNFSRKLIDETYKTYQFNEDIRHREAAKR